MVADPSRTSSSTEDSPGLAFTNHAPRDSVVRARTSRACHSRSSLGRVDEAEQTETFEQERPGTLAFADFTTRKTPVAARVCVNTPRKYVSCRGRHNAEQIAGMTLNTAIEQGRINGRKAVRKGTSGKYVAPSDAEYAKLDKVCQTFLS